MKSLSTVPVFERRRTAQPEFYCPVVAIWIALLRGINVGKAKRVAMTDLRAVLEHLGFEDVKTVLQSGNAVFAVAGAKAKAAQIQRSITEAVATATGTQASVIAVPARDFLGIVEANPFLARGVDAKELHVAFLADPPPKAKLAAIDAGALRPDEFEVGRRAIYLRMPNGQMQSKLPDWHKVLGVTATIRNWSTVSKLSDIVRERS